MIISSLSLIFICAIHSHFTWGNFPCLSFLYLQFHNYFFPFSKYLSCVIFSFFKFTIISFQLIVTFSLSLGKISPKQSDVSTLFTGEISRLFSGGNSPLCKVLLLLAYFLGEISPALTLLYLKIYDFFFLLSKYSSMLFMVFLLGKIPPLNHSVFTNLGLFLSILKIFIFHCGKFPQS